MVTNRNSKRGDVQGKTGKIFFCKIEYLILIYLNGILEFKLVISRDARVSFCNTLAGIPQQSPF